MTHDPTRSHRTGPDPLGPDPLGPNTLLDLFNLQIYKVLCIVYDCVFLLHNMTAQHLPIIRPQTRMHHRVITDKHRVSHDSLCMARNRTRGLTVHSA
jgi:hypothetical protein